MRHRRQYLLFALVVLLPCAILVVLGWRMLLQERGLAGERIEADQRQFASQARDRILAAITELPEDGNWWDTALDDSQVLAFRGPRAPWDRNRDAITARRLLYEPEFRTRIEAGRFDDALEVSHHPAQRAFARLRMAKASVEAGRSSQAFEHLTQILKSGVQLVDDQGVPFRWLAARDLIQAGIMQTEVTELLTTELNSKTPQSPAVIAVLRQVARLLQRHLPSAEQAQTFQHRLEVREHYADSVRQALALQPSVDWKVISDEAKGVETWLVRRTKEEAICIRVRPLTLSLPGRILVKQKDGQALEPDFPDLSLKLFSDADRRVTQKYTLLWWFYAVALGMVLGVSLFGGYLLWRDVNREMETAEERSNFIAGVSHELRTPLAAIRMYAETLAMGRMTDEKAKHEYAEIILAESERLGRLVDNVLDFAKIEQGKRRVYRLRPTNIAEVIRTAVRALERPLAQQGFHLQMKLDETVPEIPADSDALVRAILNLLSNAMKYSGKSREIDLKLVQRRRQAVIQVRDHGFGLEPEEREKIFEKFYRAPQPEGQAVGGTGLGLTLVKHVAEEHGGSVEVRSEPGKGSTFSIVLPME